MARPYSLDLRERVVAAVESERTCRDVAASFGVSVSSVVKWSLKVRRTGSVAPERMGGHRPFLLEAEKEWLLRRFAGKPDATLAAVLDELKGRGVHVGLSTLWRFLKRQGVSFKKNRVRHRAGPPGRGPKARPMEKTPGQD